MLNQPATPLAANLPQPSRLSLASPMPRRIAAFLLSILFGIAASSLAMADDSPPSFRRDVMAVLSKAGCNQGTCHGNANGKGGFKLSLRGDDPGSDFRALTHEAVGRRTNALAPDESLMLRKPTMRMPHEGGQRLTLDSPEYAILHAWIAAGAHDDRTAKLPTRLSVEPASAIVTLPASDVKLTVFATDENGHRHDVSRWAVFEPSQPIVEISESGLVHRNQSGELTIAIRYLGLQAAARLAFIDKANDNWTAPPSQNAIDDFVFAKLKLLGIQPSPTCDDVTFVRRAYLDLLGLLPKPDEAERFLSSKEPDRRDRLIDELLDRPEFAEQWAMKWSDLLRSEETTLDRKGVENLHSWLTVQFANDRPWNEIAHELIAARGSTYSNPAANYYRALRDPIVRAETTAQVFLGVRLQCAKCHSHPFDRWTQNDYYAWANAFARVDYKILENNRRDNNDSHEFDGEQVVFMKSSGDVKDPRTGEPRSPRMLEAEAQPLSPSSDRLEELADWIVDAKNPYFARTQVNRIWFHLMGRGLVDPIDDFRVTNPASHPELLAWLADDFVANGYRLKPTIRAIMNSTAYQLSCETNDSNADDALNYSHVVPRRLSAEVLADALTQVLGEEAEYAGYPADVRAGQLPGVVPTRGRKGLGRGDRFLKTFGKPPRLQACECERVATPTLAQTFQLVSGPLLDELLNDKGNAISQALKSKQDDEQIVASLYLAALSRQPTGQELSAARQRLSLATAESRRAVLEDFAWALLNSNEFLFRR